MAADWLLLLERRNWERTLKLKVLIFYFDWRWDRKLSSMVWADTAILYDDRHEDWTVQTRVHELCVVVWWSTQTMFTQSHDIMTYYTYSIRHLLRTECVMQTERKDWASFSCIVDMEEAQRTAYTGSGSIASFCVHLLLTCLQLRIRCSASVRFIGASV